MALIYYLDDNIADIEYLQETAPHHKVIGFTLLEELEQNIAIEKPDLILVDRFIDPIKSSEHIKKLSQLKIPMVM